MDTSSFFKVAPEPPRIVAEIGCNHKGEMEIAREMIWTAAVFCKAHVAKFQKRTNRELLSPEQYGAPHPNPTNSYGATYGEHREYLEFTLEQHRQLADWCAEAGIAYATSVWDVTSAREMSTLPASHLKVPSASNLHREMLDVLCGEYGGEIHVSLGMTTPDEQEEVVAFFEDRGRAGDVVLYSCTSGYPVPVEDVCLLEIVRLRERFGHRVKEIGFSGHHLGIAMDTAATVLGVGWIERHFTLDRTWKGTDHAASLEPDGLRRVARDTGAVASAMRYKEADLLEIEKPQRDKLKWRPRPSIAAAEAGRGA